MDCYLAYFVHTALALSRLSVAATSLRMHGELATDSLSNHHN